MEILFYSFLVMYTTLRAIQNYLKIPYLRFFNMGVLKGVLH